MADEMESVQDVVTNVVMFVRIANVGDVSLRSVQRHLPGDATFFVEFACGVRKLMS